MRNFFHFLQYHNAVPVALGILILGGGATFAATNPQALYSQTQTVVSIDNTYLVNKDLATYSPQVRINTVTEDTDNYYVDYSLFTIDLNAAAWQDVVEEEMMTVSKADLGQYRDLGVYVTQQLRQIIDREKERLADTQTIEKKNVTQAVIATSYGGLVGKFLNDSTETLPGYEPVVTAPSQGVAGSFSGPASGDASGSGATGGSGGAASTSGVQVGLQVLGNNPARLALRSSYVDLGAALLDPLRTNVGVHIFLDGVETVSPTIDTSTTTSYAIEYRVTDLLGNSIMVRRIVLVGDATDPGSEINEAGNVTPAAPPTDTQAASSATATSPGTSASSSQSATPGPIATSTPDGTSSSTAASTTQTTVDSSTASSSTPVSATTTDTTSAATTNDSSSASSTAGTSTTATSTAQ